MKPRMNQGRREFLVAGGSLVAAAASASVKGQGPPPETVELAVVNGNVLTMNPEQPRAEAFAVSQGRFVAVGSNYEIKQLVQSGTRKIDAAGATVLPGFIDAHCHPVGVDELTGVDCEVASIKEIQKALKSEAAETPPEHWVVGVKYDDTKLEEGRPINRVDLDEAVPDRPVIVKHRGGHTAVFNSRAFELAGITVDTPDPEGGQFYREDEQLTGKVVEEARAPFFRVGKWPEITRETRRKGVELISSQMAAAGLTSVHQTGGSGASLTALQDALEAGGLHFRMYFFPSGGSAAFKGLLGAGIRTGFGSEKLRIGGVKYSADGSASERTMRMSTPYQGRPDDFGLLTMTAREIHAAVEEAHRAGYQIGIHANGDVAIEMVLDAYERVQEKWPREDPRFRIEHCTLVNPSILERMQRLNVIPTPFYTYVYFHGEKWSEYGDEKVKWMFAHRSFLDHDIRVAPASDYMPGPFLPLMAIQSMVTRRDYRGRNWGLNQRVTVNEALRICTINGAYASFEEHLKGSIQEGKLADFVMLERDPAAVDPLEIKDIRVIRTYLGGEATFES